MQRHIRKHLKKLKREKKNKGAKSLVRKNKYYYSAFCLQEKIFIGVSYAEVKREAGRFKIKSGPWMSTSCKWRGPEYTIDMQNKVEGELICCPKCGGNVDFRLWMSSTKPDFIHVKENPSEKLPDTQTSGTNL